MSDDWHFWHSQLAGLEPETTPGVPHQGYFMLRRRTTRENDDTNRRPGDARKRVTISHLPMAIWKDNGVWHCRIGRCGSFEYLNDVGAIDYAFSVACRRAITFDEYTQEVGSDANV